MIQILRNGWSSLKLRFKWIICRVFPVNRYKITISNYYGRGYGDNAKYIVDKLLSSGIRFKIVWLIKDDSEKQMLPKGVDYCKIDTLKCIYHLLTSKVWIDNCRKYFIMLKSKKQLYIQTWHGGGAQKKCELDAIEKLAPSYRKMAVRDSRNTDLMISDSKFMTDLYHHSFWYNGPVYQCGYPRYDIILKCDDDIRSKVYKYFDIEKNKELVLYAPTFRADHSFKAYDIDFERLLENLNRRFDKEYVVLVHLHPNVANIKGGISYNGRTIINSTFYPDTQELVAVSSILVGDYSSINYDFSLKRMPVFRYTSDLEEYRNDRDLYFSFEDYPYPYAQNNDDLEKLILNFDEEVYLQKLNKFFEQIGSVITDNASEQLSKLIIDFAQSKNKEVFFEKNKNKFIY